MKAHCNKCKKETELVNSYVDIITTPKGARRMLKGLCGVCKQKVTQMVGVK
jgi:hypothetical protein